MHFLRIFENSIPGIYTSIIKAYAISLACLTLGDQSVYAGIDRYSMVQLSPQIDIV